LPFHAFNASSRGYWEETSQNPKGKKPTPQRDPRTRVQGPFPNAGAEGKGRERRRKGRREGSGKPPPNKKEDLKPDSALAFL
jgi:hypothetical protein